MQSHDDEAIHWTQESARDVLDIRPDGEDCFRASGGKKNYSGTVYGGRLIGQALLAAGRTVPDMPATSLHAYFLAAGRVDLPVEYRVSRLRDSRRFANRQVAALQDGATIFVLMAQFHAPEVGFAHQLADMPDVPPPEALVPLEHYVRERAGSIHPAAVRNYSGPLPVEVRPVAPDDYLMARSRRPRDFWFRLPGAAALDDLALHQCLLAYASDYWLAGAAAAPHIFPTSGRHLLISSLDHALWFHRPTRCDDWLLYHTSSPSAGDGLGLAQGRIFDRDGRLVASAAQECLIRPLREDG